jgi:lipopolysaccharide transport system ATP-binding protein
VAELCDRAVWIDQGRLQSVGPAEPVCKAYTQSVWDHKEAANLNTTGQASQKLAETAETGRYVLGGGTIRITSVTAIDENGKPKGVIRAGEALTLRIDWEGETSHPQVYCSFRVDGERLQAVTGFEAYEHGAFMSGEEPLKGRGSVFYTIPKLDLGPGTYHVSAGLCRHMLPKGGEAILHYVEKACQLTVVRRTLWNFTYIYDPEMTWRFVKEPA